MNVAYNIDCMEYMKTIPDQYFEIAVVDPPYGSSVINKNGGGIKDLVDCSNDTKQYNRFGKNFERYRRGLDAPTIKRRGGGYDDKYGKGAVARWDVAPTEEYFEELFRVSKNQVIWGGNYFDLPPTRCFLVWHKTTMGDCFSMANVEYAWTSFFDNAKIYQCAPNGTKNYVRFHPTQKPVGLYEWIYGRFVKEGDKILDTHLGSGSSRIAAYNMGLDFVGCEIDKDYFDKQEQRFKLETAQRNIFEMMKGE